MNEPGLDSRKLSRNIFSAPASAKSSLAYSVKWWPDEVRQQSHGAAGAAVACGHGEISRADSRNVRRNIVTQLEEEPGFGRLDNGTVCALDAATLNIFRDSSWLSRPGSFIEWAGRARIIGV